MNSKKVIKVLAILVAFAAAVVGACMTTLHFTTSDYLEDNHV